MNGFTYNMSCPGWDNLADNVRCHLDKNSSFIQLAILGALVIIIISFCHICVGNCSRKSKRRSVGSRRTEVSRGEHDDERYNMTSANRGNGEGIEMSMLPLQSTPLSNHLDSPRESFSSHQQGSKQTADQLPRSQMTNLSVPALPPRTSLDSLKQRESSADRVVNSRPRSGTHPGADPGAKRYSMMTFDSGETEDIDAKVHHSEKESTKSEKDTKWKGSTSKEEESDKITVESAYCLVSDIPTNCTPDENAPPMAENRYGRLSNTSRSMLPSTSSSVSETHTASAGRHPLGSELDAGSVYRPGSNQSMNRVFNNAGDVSTQTVQKMDKSPKVGHGRSGDRSTFSENKDEKAGQNFQQTHHRENSSCSIYSNLTIESPQATHREYKHDQGLDNESKVTQMLTSDSDGESIYGNYGLNMSKDIYKNQSATSRHDGTFCYSAATFPRSSHSVAPSATVETMKTTTEIRATDAVDDNVGKMSLVYDHLQRPSCEKEDFVPEIKNVNPANPAIILVGKSAFEEPQKGFRNLSTSSTTSSHAMSRDGTKRDGDTLHTLYTNLEQIFDVLETRDTFL